LQKSGKGRGDFPSVARFILWRVKKFASKEMVTRRVVIEAKKRGLNNFKTTPDALEAWTNKKFVDLFARHGVMTEPRATRTL